MRLPDAQVTYRSDLVRQPTASNSEPVLGAVGIEGHLLACQPYVARFHHAPAEGRSKPGIRARAPGSATTSRSVFFFFDRRGPRRPRHRHKYIGDARDGDVEPARGHGPPIMQSPRCRAASRPSSAPDRRAVRFGELWEGASRAAFVTRCGPSTHGRFMVGYSAAPDRFQGFTATATVVKPWEARARWASKKLYGKPRFLVRRRDRGRTPRPVFASGSIDRGRRQVANSLGRRGSRATPAAGDAEPGNGRRERRPYECAARPALLRARLRAGAFVNGARRGLGRRRPGGVVLAGSAARLPGVAAHVPPGTARSPRRENVADSFCRGQGRGRHPPRRRRSPRSCARRCADRTPSAR